MVGGWQADGRRTVDRPSRDGFYFGRASVRLFFGLTAPRDKMKNINMGLKCKFINIFWTDTFGP